jgi:hypothetical protein
MDNTTEPFNSLEGYFNIPKAMIDSLKDDIKCTKQEDLQKPASQLYILYSLKMKLKNCLTPDLSRNIETSMPTGISASFSSRSYHTLSQTKKPTNVSSMNTSCNLK